MEKIKALIADDSVLFRAHIRAALLDFGWIEVVGAVKNGRVAVERLSVGDIDLLILDLEMPEMDGLEALREIQTKGLKTKILVFSSNSRRSAVNAIESLKLGAADFIAKPGLGDDPDEALPSQKIKTLIESRINALFGHGSPSAAPKQVVSSTPFQSQLWDLFRPDVVVIGSSTGGPSVLEEIFGQISGPLRCPILITQHMPPVFTAALAERIKKLCGVACAEAVHGEKLQNQIYIAPGDFHMTLAGVHSQVRVELDQSPQVHSVRPAVDPLFETASDIFKGKCLGIVLTGMGSDGRDGALRIKQNGGRVLIQDENSSIVYGMPGSVQAVGAFDRVLTPTQITGVIRDKAMLDPTASRVGA